MTEVTFDEHVIRNAVQDAVTRESRLVLRELLDDGVEFEAVCNCVLVWAHKTRGIGFAKGKNVWHVMHTDTGQAGTYFYNEAGSQLIFRSFHELLQWLFDQPELEIVTE